jgi:UPF0271 protein
VRIDLNADLGEGFGIWRLTDDESLLHIVTSANVACGFHAGDPAGLREVVSMAAARGVVVGAQVSYRDLVGFGRRFLDVSPAELEAEVVYQVGALDALCRVEGTSVSYVKPHGALYAACLTHPEQGAAVSRAAALLELPLLHGLLPGAVREVFADRGYASDGTLVPRDQPGALLGVEEAVAQALRLAATGDAASICVHGDSPDAVLMARQVRAALEDAGIVLAPFA